MPLFLSRIAVLIAIAACLAGCDLVRPFEQVCERKLGPAEVSVEVAPVRYDTDFSQSSGQLTARGAQAAGRIVLGLTETQLKGAISFGGNGVKKPMSGRFCMRPVVAVKLAFDPMLLSVAREQKEGSCEHKLTMDHEMRHMRVYTRYLDDLAARISADLKAKLGDKILYFKDVASADAEMQALTSSTLKPYLENGLAEVQKLQKAIDSPEEYARMDALQARCGS
jgi:hypothetical protein